MQEAQPDDWMEAHAWDCAAKRGHHQPHSSNGVLYEGEKATCSSRLYCYVSQRPSL